jgi:hypothetical protein
MMDVNSRLPDLALRRRPRIDGVMETVPTMSPAELGEILDLLEWSNRQLGKRIGFSEGQVRRWLNNSRTVPDQIAAWLRQCAAVRRAHPFEYPPAPERDWS